MNVFCDVMGKMEVRDLLKDKKLWIASFLIAWAAALQGHMMWVQRQDSFKQKFGNQTHKDDEFDDGKLERQNID